MIRYSNNTYIIGTDNYWQYDSLRRWCSDMSIHIGGDVVPLVTYMEAVPYFSIAYRPIEFMACPPPVMDFLRKTCDVEWLSDEMDEYFGKENKK